jgi:hypothetical protein
MRREPCARNLVHVKDSDTRRQYRAAPRTEIRRAVTPDPLARQEPPGQGRLTRDSADQVQPDEAAEIQAKRVGAGQGKEVSDRNPLGVLNRTCPFFLLLGMPFDLLGLMALNYLSAGKCRNFQTRWRYQRCTFIEK